LWPRSRRSPWSRLEALPGRDGGIGLAHAAAARAGVGPGSLPRPGSFPPAGRRSPRPWPGTVSGRRCRRGAARRNRDHAGAARCHLRPGRRGWQPRLRSTRPRLDQLRRSRAVSQAQRRDQAVPTAAHKAPAPSATSCRTTPPPPASAAADADVQAAQAGIRAARAAKDVAAAAASAAQADEARGRGSPGRGEGCRGPSHDSSADGGAPVADVTVEVGDAVTAGPPLVQNRGRWRLGLRRRPT